MSTPRGIADAAATRAALLERSLTRSAAERVAAAQVPDDMIALIGSGQLALDWVQEAVQWALQSGAEASSAGQALWYDPGDVTLLAPVPRPAGIVNFSVWPAHAAGASSLGIQLTPNRADSPIKPYWKGNPDAVVGPGTVLECPAFADAIDVECELVCIVGTGGRDLDPSAAEQAIAGYSIMNDVSARQRQAEEMKTGRGPSKGKDFDNGNPLGPWLVTRDEVGDVSGLRMSLHVNGRELSSCDASGMIWSFPQMLAYLSIGQTVPPGTVISGGCYSGGSAHEMGVRLVPGDQVEMRISRLGGLANTIGSQRPAPAA
ncbi:MAG: fumarylacetoacetate hydrolase family protein [Burkholderiales bacterium]|nr:fumarylacetoacetate hydrolase family protein [Burkholderiales bacterium]